MGDAGQKKPWRDMSTAERECAESEIARFLEEHLATDENPDGILSLPIDPETGEERRLYWHQVQTARRLMRTNPEPIDKRRDSMLAIHDVGTGKTVTAILVLAAVHRLVAQARKKNLPNFVAKKVVIVAPKSLLGMWENAIREWTCTWFHERVLVVRDHKTVKKDMLAHLNNEVIIVSPTMLAAAYKVGVVLQRGTKVRGEPLAGRLANRVNGNGSLVEKHPLFAMLPIPERHSNGKIRPSFATPVALTVIDEVHLNLEPSIWTTAAIQCFTNDSRLVLGLTGTPVRNDPDEVAYAARLLNVSNPDSPKGVPRIKFSDPKTYRTNDGQHEINVGVIEKFRKQCVDRVDKSFVDMPLLVETVVEYDPFVGVGSDGARDKDAILHHNEALRKAKGEPELQEAEDGPKPPVIVVELAGGEETPEPEEVQEKEEELPPPAPAGKKWSEPMGSVFSAMITLGHYELSPVLGLHGAAKFKENDALFQEAIERPSQAMLLIERVMRNRQNEGGHARIAVFAEYVTQLRIVQRYLEGDARFGKLYVLHGQLSDKKRDVELQDFLACERGVLFLTKAGGVGLNLQKGCACMISIGSLPWNAADMEQVIGRVYRIGQKVTVEFIQIVARRSITAAKRGLHEDKGARLSEALKNGNYENFADDKRAWRWTSRMLDYVEELDSAGNYKVTPKYLEALRDHAAGRTSKEPSPVQTPVLPSRMALPRFGAREE
jgi:hypothetical protein